jgi:hypothetical protein
MLGSILDDCSGLRRFGSDNRRIISKSFRATWYSVGFWFGYWGLFGLLFGIPRSLTVAGQTVQANTNFEQISDQLTKVLIGVSLAELNPIKDFLVSLEKLLEGQLSGTQIGGVAGLATLVAYFFAGFLWSYFESRTSLMAIFGEATRAGPQVTGLNPARGAISGDEVVTITGVGFTGASAVNFGPNLASDVNVSSDTQITAKSPAGTGAAASNESCCGRSSRGCVRRPGIGGVMVTDIAEQEARRWQVTTAAGGPPDCGSDGRFDNLNGDPARFRFGERA